MITCTPDRENGVMSIDGITPNGDGVVSRTVPGAAPFLLRGGVAPIVTGGIALVDTEAPFGVPLDYVVTVSNITSANRLVQQNLALTPTFLHGVQTWTAGTGRTLTTPADATAHSAAAVGQVTSTASVTTPTTPPTLIGHKDSAVGVSGSYTLDPATPTGGAAVATNDWMLIIHSQLSSAANPADPSGWTRIDDVTANANRQIIWKRKRQAGDTSYVVAAASGAQSIGSLLWVRGSGDTLTTSVTTTVATAGSSTTLTTGSHAVIRPSLVVSVFNASGTIGLGANLIANAGIRASGGIAGAVRGARADIVASGVGTGLISGATWNYTINATSSTRNLVVATNSQVEASDSPYVTAAYGSVLTTGFATQIAFHVADVLTNRIVAVTKAAAIPSTTANAPHLLTGRFKFTHPGLWTWQDVLNQGTWQNLKNTKATWLDVRGSSSTVAGTSCGCSSPSSIPATGNDLIPPQQVITRPRHRVNTWLNFSVLFANASTFPATAEIRLVHGSTTKEFGIQLDARRVRHHAGHAAVRPRRRCTGSTATRRSRRNSPDYLLGPGWTVASSDAAIIWTGTVGNSTSEFRTASALTTTTTCQLDPPDVLPEGTCPASRYSCPTRSTSPCPSGSA